MSLCLVFGLAAIGPSAHALKISLNQDLSDNHEQVIDLTGTVEKGDVAKLQHLISSLPISTRNRFVLEIEGGDLEEALRLGQLVHANRFATEVPRMGTCKTACFYILLAGRNSLGLQSIQVATNASISVPPRDIDGQEFVLNTRGALENVHLARFLKEAKERLSQTPSLIQFGFEKRARRAPEASLQNEEGIRLSIDQLCLARFRVRDSSTGGWYCQDREITRSTATAVTTRATGAVGDGAAGGNGASLTDIEGYVATHAVNERVGEGVLNMRKGPSVKFGVADELVYGTFVKYLKHTGNWVNVELETGEKGWVHGRFLAELYTE